MNACSSLLLCAAVATAAPGATALGARNAATAPRVGGLMTERGMAGVVQSTSPSQILFTVEEHVTFTANISASTQFVQNGQPVPLSQVQPGGWIFVRGTFDLAAHTVNAEMIRLTPPQGARVLQHVFDNFGTTWTAGVITSLQSGSVTLQRMDGATQTIGTDGNTSYRPRDQTADASLLRAGERVRVQLQPGNPSLARQVTIQGKAR